MLNNAFNYPKICVPSKSEMYPQMLNPRGTCTPKSKCEWECWWWSPQQPSWRYSIVSSPVALFQVSWCRGLLTMVCPSSLCPSVTFHIFDISIRIVSMITAMAAILEVFSCYLLPTSKSDKAETWWKASGQHGDLEMLKQFSSDIQDGHHGIHLENLQIRSAPEW